MLSLVACFGFTPCKTFETSIQVYSKLGGTFLGAIQRPCLKEVDAYSVLRKFQDQVATWLQHPKMPPRYLALFVGSTRLTSPDFPFVDHLDSKSSQQVLDVLSKALWIEAMWDEDLTCAKERLSSKAVRVDRFGNSLAIYKGYRGHRVNNVSLPDELLMLELEAFSFRADIHEITAHRSARRLGRTDMFPDLKRLSLVSLLDFDFEQASKSKRLTFLRVDLPVLDKDVGLMLGLQTLDVQVDSGCIPDSIGLLTGLTDLTLKGFHGNIPSRLGDLVELKKLAIQNTKLSGNIPSELCRLTNLSTLLLQNNPQLKGSLPKEFNNLSLLDVVCFNGSPINTKRGLDGWCKCMLGYYYSPLWLLKNR